MSKAKIQPKRKSAGSAYRTRGPGVSEEQRHKLAECCAFFMAERYRDAEPGKIRKQDIETAEADIDTAIRKFCKP